MIGGTHIAGIRGFTSFYLRWRVRALAYLMLLEDAYPPFGDGPYPAAIEIVDPAGPRDRVTVALRILLAIPQFVVLFFVLLAWCFTTIAAWLMILFTGSYPQGCTGSASVPCDGCCGFRRTSYCSWMITRRSRLLDVIRDVRGARDGFGSRQNSQGILLM